MDQEQLMDFLVSSYQKVTGPLPVVGSAMDLAESYRHPEKSVHDSVDSLIKWQCSKTAASGFVSGLGGIITLPVAIPADLAQSMYVQLRMVAAIGHLYGFDVHSEKVRTLCFASLCGGSAAEILSNAGIKIGQKIAHNLIKSISRETIIAINKKVGFRLLTKFGTTGVVNLGKMIPFFGGGVGAIMNLTYTYSVGKAAKAIMGGETVENEMPNDEVIVVESKVVSANSVHDGYGPRIHGLQLGLNKTTVFEKINKLQEKYHLVRDEEDNDINLISENNKQTQISIEFDENERIISFSMSPKIFNVKNFISPKFVYDFKQYYRLPNLVTDLEDPEALKEINEDENYSVSLQNNKLEVQQLYEENPFFE